MNRIVAAQEGDARKAAIYSNARTMIIIKNLIVIFIGQAPEKILSCTGVALLCIINSIGHF